MESITMLLHHANETKLLIKKARKEKKKKSLYLEKNFFHSLLVH